jgi:hypothetical protein
VTEWGDAVTVQESYYELDWDGVRHGQDLAYIETPQKDMSLCTCDLTKFICDITADGGCGCDEDCKGFLPESLASLPEGTIENTVKYCADLDSANVGTHALGTATLEEEGFTLAAEFEENQLCVVQSNSPSLGNFYTDPGKAIQDSPSSVTASVTADHVMRVSIDAGDYSSETEQYTFATKSEPFVSTSDAYGYGDVLLADNDGAGCSGDPYGRSHMILPSVGLDGSCSDESGTFIGQSVSPTACVRRPAGTLEESCEYEFSAKPYVGRPDDQKTRCFRAQPSAQEPTKVEVVVRTHEATEDFEPLDWTRGGPVLIPETKYESNICKNAVAKVQYTVFHTGKGRVDEVVVELWYKNIEDPFAVQEFGVQYVMKDEFASFDEFAELTKDGFTKKRVERSGMPGYVPGSPVLSGRRATHTYLPDGAASGEEKQKVGVEEREGGMAVVGMGFGGRCIGGSRPVKYGHDAVGACNVALTRDELKTACDAQGNDDAPYGLYTPLFNPTDVVIGVFGDSDPTIPAEWIDLEQEGSDVPTAEWSEERGLCDRLVTGLSVTVYTAAVGNELQPQNKIVGAYYSYVTTSVQYARPVTQEIELRTVVTFVELPDRIMVEQVLATPRIVPTMPADFFYPFTLSTSGSTPNGGVPLLAVLVLSLLTARWW